MTIVFHNRAEALNSITEFQVNNFRFKVIHAHEVPVGVLDEFWEVYPDHTEDVKFWLAENGRGFYILATTGENCVKFIRRADGAKVPDAIVAELCDAYFDMHVHLDGFLDALLDQVADPVKREVAWGWVRIVILIALGMMCGYLIGERLW